MLVISTSWSSSALPNRRWKYLQNECWWVQNKLIIMKNERRIQSVDSNLIRMKDGIFARRDIFFSKVRRRKNNNHTNSTFECRSLIRMCRQSPHDVIFLLTLCSFLRPYVLGKSLVRCPCLFKKKPARPRCEVQTFKTTLSLRASSLVSWSPSSEERI